MKNEANQKVLGWKWYKFLIYVTLLVGPVFSVLQSFAFFSGSIYEVQTNGQVTADMVYEMYNSLQLIDCIWGVCLIAMAVFAIVVRTKLVGYKADAIKYCNIYFLIGPISSFLYTLISCEIISTQITSQTFTTLIGGLVLYFLNKNYFKKRERFFGEMQPTQQ